MLGCAGLAVLAHGEGTRLAVEAHHLEVGLRVGEAAVRAARLAEVAEVAVVVVERGSALGARGQIARDALRAVGVAGEAADRVVCALPRPRCETARDQVVGVQHELGHRGDARGEHAEDVVRVRVAHERVAVEVADEQQVGRDVRQDEPARELVELHARDLQALVAREVRVLDERALDAVDRVAARPVGDQVEAVVGEQIVEEVGRGGLAVGAGHEDDAPGFADMREEIRVDLLGDDAGKLPALALEGGQEGVRRLARSHRQTEAHALLGL